MMPATNSTACSEPVIMTMTTTMTSAELIKLFDVSPQTVARIAAQVGAKKQKFRRKLTSMDAAITLRQPPIFCRYTFTEAQLAEATTLANAAKVHRGTRS